LQYKVIPVLPPTCLKRSSVHVDILETVFWCLVNEHQGRWWVFYFSFDISHI